MSNPFQYVPISARSRQIPPLRRGGEDIPSKPSKPETHSASLRYMGGLDGLRAIAVLAVILYHLNGRWAPGGLLGVGIFFVLSGYLITDILVSGWKKTGTIGLGSFWLRRARRLFPAMLTVVTAVLAWTAITGVSIPSLSGDALASLFYVNNWRLIFHKVSYFESFGTPSPLGHLWSLAVEEQFYVFWPLILALALRISPKRGRLIGLTLALALLSALSMKLLFVPGMDPSRVYYGTDTRAFGLLIGAALALIRPSGGLATRGIRLPGRLLLDAAGCSALAAIVWMIFHTDEYSAALYPGGLLLLSVLAAVLIAVLAHPASRLGSLLGARPLRWLGKRAYGIYLWHYPIIVLTTAAVNTEGPALTRSALQVAATLILAALSFKYLEEPIRRGALPRWWRSLSNRTGRKLALRQAGYLFLGIALFFGGASQLFPGAQASGMNAGASAGRAAVPSSPPDSGAGNRTSAPSPAVTPAASPSAALDGHSGYEDGGSKPGSPRQTPPSAKTPAAEPDGHSKPSPSAAGTASPAAGQGKGKASEAVPSASPALSSPTAPAGNAKPPGHSGKEGKGTTAIGDSVLLDAEPYYRKLVPKIAVNGKIGRQLWDAQGIVDSLKASGELGNRVIFNLGTNGAFSEKQLQALLDSLKEADQVIFVNVRVPRPWETNVNSMLARVVKEYPNAELIDWYGASAGHDEYFAPDGVHLNPAGAEAYARLVVDDFAAGK